MNLKKTTILSLFLFLTAVTGTGTAELFIDNFDSLNMDVWGCEFSCPTVSDGIATFHLEPGETNTNETWSKLSYKPERFGYGSFSMRFRYSRRPLEAEVWAGWALYSASAGVHEINFGIETACVQRCDETTLQFESYRNSNNTEVIVHTGLDLYDGAWHTVGLTYAETGIVLYFDGEEISGITDLQYIPTEPMRLIPGARVVSGSLDSPFDLEVDFLTISDETDPPTKARQKERIMFNPVETGDARISIYNALGKELCTVSKSELYDVTRTLRLPDYIRGSGVYIIQYRSGNSVTNRRVLLNR